MSPNMLKVRFGLSEIKLLFLVLLGFCTIALIRKLVYISSEDVSTFKDPTPKPGWNRDFERDIDNKWIVAVSRIKRKLTRPVRVKGYTVVYVTEKFNENDLQMCRTPDCIYIDPREQRSMAFKIIKHLPSGMSSRRLIGFLHAMSRGAKVIYYKHVYQNSSTSFPNMYSYTVMVYTLDPESVLDLRKTNFNQTSKLSVPWQIYHKYLLKREGGDIPTKPSKHKGEKKTMYEHSSSKSGNGFTVLDSSLSSFQYKSFWALIFHTLFGSTGRSITRRLMQETRVGISLNCFPETNFVEVQSNSVLGISRKKKAKEQKRLEDVLKHWECDPSFRFFSCVIDISHVLSCEELISHNDLEIIKSWIMDLILINIYEPVRRFDLRKKIETPLSSIHHALSRPGHQAFSAICPGVMLLNNEPVINDIALVIVFNEASLYSNIQLLESIYRGYFKHIIYCGPHLDSFTEHSAEQKEIFHFVFIEALQQGWHLFYECLMLASQMNIDVNGYIQIGDDTLLNPWNLKKLPRNELWLHTGIDALNISLVDIDPHWVWWQSRWGKSAVLKSLDFIISEASFEGVDSIFSNFKKTYLANSEGLAFIYRQSCDFMYLPKVHVDNYLKIGSIFLKNEAMVEVAHGTIIMGLAPYKDIVFIKDGSLYTSDEKTTVWMSYDRKYVFLHPFKLSYMKAHTHLRSVFCEKYMVDSEMNLST